MAFEEAQRLARALAELAVCKNLREKKFRIDCIDEVREYFISFIFQVAEYQIVDSPELLAFMDIMELYFATDGNGFFFQELSSGKNVDVINVELSALYNLGLKMSPHFDVPDVADTLQHEENILAKRILQLIFSHATAFSLKKIEAKSFHAEDAVWDTVLFLRQLGVINWTIPDEINALDVLNDLKSIHYKLTQKGKQTCRGLFPKGKSKRSPALVINIFERKKAQG